MHHPNACWTCAASTVCCCCCRCERRRRCRCLRRNSTRFHALFGALSFVFAAELCGPSSVFAADAVAVATRRSSFVLLGARIIEILLINKYKIFCLIYEFVCACMC